VGDLDDSFTALLGRQPTDREKQALYRTRDALKLKTTDAVWLLLMALQHYETLYEQVPAKIATAARTSPRPFELQRKQRRQPPRKLRGRRWWEPSEMRQSGPPRLPREPRSRNG
jgi:hypothetical protein